MIEVDPPSDASQTELASLAAKAFEATVLAEDAVLGSFLEGKCGVKADGGALAGRKRTASSREQLDSEPALPGEQVAAKMTKSEEDGSWIIGSVLQYEQERDAYLIQDEDDPSRIVSLSSREVRRLEDSAASLRRGDAVMAVFPETTSFYRAVVAKHPKAPLHSGASCEVVVRFEDDEDESGKNPARRVPARFVLRRGLMEGGEEGESEEED